MKGVLVAIAAAVTAALTVAPSARADVDAPRCFWGRPTDPNVVNVAYPDKGATYWGGRPAVPPGAELVLRGRYAHARYLSFNTYDEQLAPFDALADIEIGPDPGSANPFLAGADRTVTPRDYTIRVRSGPVPTTRDPNTLYLGAAGQGAPASAFLLYRVYVPDEGRDLTGDAGLPTVALHLADGTVVNLTAACTPADATRPVGSEIGSVPLQQAFADGSLPGTPLTYPAQDPPKWEKFFSLGHVQVAVATDGTPVRAFADDYLADNRGGYLSNVHNAYILTLANRGFGPVLVIRLVPPTTPSTRDGAATMDTGQLRYWSLCTNERHSTRYVDCLVDEDAVVDASGQATVVVSSPADRPANATPQCGVRWLAWGTSPETLLILRHMLPDPTFANAIQRVQRPADLTAVMGAYLPSASYTTTADFTAEGCPL